MILLPRRHLAWPVLGIGTIGLLALVSGRRPENTGTATRVAPTTLARFGPEVRAVVAAPCPTDLLYPIGSARRVELGWGMSTASPAADVRFTAELRTRKGRTEVLVDDASGATTPWSSRFVDLPRDAAGGTLALRTHGASPASHWAPPVFSGAPQRSSNRNVVVVSLDTVRADHLNTYGYTRRRTSPELDAWAERGTLFETAMSTAPGTLSSQMSILTGRYPSRHGVSYASWRESGRMPVLRDEIPTLAEVLQAHGYRTAAFTGAGYFALPIGYARGFDAFVSSTDRALGSAETVFEKGFAWLARHRDEAFFLFLHTYEAHEPYLDRRFVDAEGERLGDERSRNEALYDGDIRRADAYLGKLRRRLERLGLTERTLVVVLSDHGEEFGDHFPVWNDGHGHSLFEEQVHVPLMVAGPHVAEGRRVKEAVDLTRVAPTVLTFLGVEPPAGMEARGLLTAGVSDAEGVAFSEDVWIGPAARAVRTRDWKLIERGQPLPERFVDRDERRQILAGVGALSSRLLFHLPSDPREREDRLGSREVVGTRLAELLEAGLNRGPRVGPDAEIEVEGEVVERLRALGYVQ
jgi:arylsulfatase A-like enzyme